MKLSESYSIPDHLWREIHRYDPRVTLTWSGREGKVRVERFGCHVLSFEPREENYYKLLYTLRHQDIWTRAQGGKSGSQMLYEKIEEDAARTAQQLRKHWDDQREWDARESWGYMNTVRTVPEKYAHTAPRGGMSIN